MLKRFRIDCEWDSTILFCVFSWCAEVDVGTEGFEDTECFDNVLPEIDMWNGENDCSTRPRKLSWQLMP